MKSERDSKQAKQKRGQPKKAKLQVERLKNLEVDRESVEDVKGGAVRRGVCRAS